MVLLAGRPRRSAPGDDLDPAARIGLGVAVLAGVLAVGTVGYVILGVAPLDAVYQTVTTVSTVGFREVEEPDRAFKLFTIFIVLAGAGTVLYVFGVVVETLVEGRLTDHLERRRMGKEIASLEGHVVACGWGRVGRSLSAYLAGAGMPVVVIDRDSERAATVPGYVIHGDATDDAVLQAAGIDRARALVAALASDADNLYVTLTGRSLRPELFIVARARVEAAEAKLRQAGANRVVNPQSLGGARMAALVSAPNVADFLDVVMHDGSLDFRLGEVVVPERSPLDGHTLRSANIRERTGALVLALRRDGGFATNPPPDTDLVAGDVLIVIGTDPQVKALSDLARESGADR